jgi:hypothetical protein
VEQPFKRLLIRVVEFLLLAECVNSMLRQKADGRRNLNFSMAAMRRMCH